MKKLVLALAAVAALGIALPLLTSAPADAQTVVVKKKHVYSEAPRRRVVITEGRSADRVVVVKKKRRPANRVIIRTN